jgi:aminopeptidase N
MRDDAGAMVLLADYRPAAYVIDHIALDFDLHSSATIVKAVSSVRRVADVAEPLVLDGVALTLNHIAINGSPLPASAYRLESDKLVIFDPPAQFDLAIETLIDPAANTALEGLYLSGGRFCTQCEAEGFRKITYSLDRPDALSRYTVRVEADKTLCPTLLSNGNPIRAGDNENGRHFAVWSDPFPKPSYLFALVAGAFDSIEDSFTTMSGRRVGLAIHVDHGEADRALYAMDALKRSMDWDETVFKREYDLDVFNIVAVRDFNFGAMENKGLNVFNAAFVLADAESATDADFEAIEAVVAHEYFHNWTGNRITLRDWFQLCLKEGLTVYRDQEFSADQRSRAVQRIKDVKTLRARQFPEDAGPLAHPVRPTAYAKIDNFYTPTVYEKGAELVRVLRALIGETAFEQGMALYFERCDGTAATVEDFIAAFTEASGRDLSDFARWYAQSGTPRLVARGVYDEPSRIYSLHLTQSTPPTPGQPDKRPLPIPLKLGLLDRDGAPLSARLGAHANAALEHAFVLDAASATFVFHDVASTPIHAPLRGLNAPVLLEDGLSPSDRLVQMAHEPDAFTRWDAGQRLMREAVAHAAGLSTDGPDLAALADALGRELDRAHEDPAFGALALRAPDLADLVRATPSPDPERLFAGRVAVRAALARALEPRLRALATATSNEPFSASADAAGRRALRTAAIDLLAALGPEAESALADAFANAKTMTESIAALDALGQIEGDAFDHALEAFLARWRERPLVVDKWFAVQASAARADIQDRVRRLAGHDLFTLRNPNRARSLFSAFALRNTVAFHAADGRGYEFLADGVIGADALNPAVASRLLTAFETYRLFDERRRLLARAALERVAATAGISRNAADIAARMLD